MESRQRNKAQMPYTCACGQKLDLEALLDRLPSNGMGSSAMLSTACSSCGASIELRLHNGGFDVGYSYFGGSMHFEPAQTVSMKGLTGRSLLKRRMLLWRRPEGIPIRWRAAIL
jgi:hypothetical protein